MVEMSHILVKRSDICRSLISFIMQNWCVILLGPRDGRTHTAICSSWPTSKYWLLIKKSTLSITNNHKTYYLNSSFNLDLESARLLECTGFANTELVPGDQLAFITVRFFFIGNVPSRPWIAYFLNKIWSQFKF